MKDLVRDVKKFLIQQVLNKEDLAEVGKAYLAAKGIGITDGEESLTVVIQKRSRDEQEEDAE